jgi:hypothetical protein
VPSQSSDLVGYRRRAATQGPRHLSVGHASDYHQEHPIAEFGELLPVVRREGLYTECTVARETCKPLDTVGCLQATVETLPLIRPFVTQRVKVCAVRVRAVRRIPSRRSSSHAPAIAPPVPGTISRPQLN